MCPSIRKDYLEKPEDIFSRFHPVVWFQVVVSDLCRWLESRISWPRVNAPPVNLILYFPLCSFFLFIYILISTQHSRRPISLLLFFF